MGLMARMKKRVVQRVVSDQAPQVITDTVNRTLARQLTPFQLSHLTRAQRREARRNAVRALSRTAILGPVVA